MSMSNHGKPILGGQNRYQSFQKPMNPMKSTVMSYTQKLMPTISGPAPFAQANASFLGSNQGLHFPSNKISSRHSIILRASKTDLNDVSIKSAMKDKQDADNL